MNDDRPSEQDSLPLEKTVEVEVEEPGNGNAHEAARQSVLDPILARARIGWDSAGLLVLLSLAIVATAMVGAFLFSRLQTPQYLAEADLVIDTSDLTNTGLMDRRLATLEVMAQSSLVVDAVAETTGIPGSEVWDALTVEVTPNTAVIEFRATHPDSEDALSIVTAASRRFQEMVAADSEDADSDPIRSAIQDEITTIENRLDEIDEELTGIDAARSAAIEAGSPPVVTARETTLLTEHSNLFSRLSTLEIRLLETQVEQEQIAAPTPLGSPRVTGQEVGTPTLNALAIGGFIGLVLAAIAVFSILLLGTRARAAGGNAGPAGTEGPRTTSPGE